MRIRPFNAGDWTAVCAIYDRAKPDEMRGTVDAESIVPLAMDLPMRTLFDASQIFVAETDGRIAGFGGSRADRITWLFVDTACRRRGIATALLSHIMATLGSASVTLNVMASNMPARTLYARAGFAVEREFDGSFQGIACRVMKLRYSSPD